MNILTLDFETHFDDEYSLKKLTTEHYVRDSRFEAHMLGVRNPNGNLFWLGREQIPVWLKTVDWSHSIVLAHHAQFDGLILSHHYDVRPKMWLDTLSMARLMLGNHLSVALESLARHYGLSGKTVPYERIRGVHWADMDHGLRQELGAGCLHDVALTYDIFCRLMRGERQ